MNYEKKYLKYKQKYLSLKNIQRGGGLTLDEFETLLKENNIIDAKMCAAFINKTSPSLLQQEERLKSTIVDMKKLQDAQFHPSIICRVINLNGKIDDAIKLKKELDFDDIMAYIGGRFIPSDKITTRPDTNEWMNKMMILGGPKKNLAELKEIIKS